MKERILFLVASEVQLPVIEYAKRKGYYIITCDNEPSNPGHSLADHSLIISTYNKERIYQEVKNIGVDAVVTFISEHGLESAAYLSSKLGIAGIKPDVLLKLTDKGKFRSFMQHHSFSQPKNIITSTFQQDLDKHLTYPIIVKPVDKGANVGISKVNNQRDLPKAFNLAQTESRSNRVILEEYIDGTPVNGDCLVCNNKIVAHLTGDYLFDNTLNPILPYATLFPTDADVSGVLYQLQHILDSLDFGNGIINFEAIIKGKKVFIVEINPRFSGNYIYKLMNEAFNTNFAEICVEVALGKEYAPENFKKNNRFYSYSLLGARKKGKFVDLYLDPVLNKHLIFKKLFKEKGSLINGFSTLHSRIALLLMEFDEKETMEHVNINIGDYFKISLESYE